MEKPQFLRLPEEKKRRILNKGKSVYIQYDYTEITIRFLTEKMGMDMATFYRYFENKDDLLVYAYRDLIIRTPYEDCGPIYHFINEYEEEMDSQFLEACRKMMDKEIRDKLLSAERDVLYPLLLRKFKAEKYKGNIREDVDEGLAAYLYSSVGLNLYDYFEQEQIVNDDLRGKIKEYVFGTFFLRAIEK